MTGASKGAVLKLIADLGPVCAAYMDQAFHDLPCTVLEMDEIWAFCGSKAKNVKADKKGVFGFGDAWTFTAICADTKHAQGFLWAVGEEQKNVSLDSEDERLAIMAVEWSRMVGRIARVIENVLGPVWRGTA